MNVFDLDVRRICVDKGLNRYLWECGLSWDEVALLIADPVCFVQSALGQRLGNLSQCPIVLVQFSYPGIRHGEQNEHIHGADVVIRGIDDTSVITAIVKRPFHSPDGPLELHLHEDMRVQIILRRRDRLATAHFHLAGDNLGLKKETYTLVRNPTAYADAINRRIYQDDGGVEAIVIDGAEPPNGCEESDGLGVKGTRCSWEAINRVMAEFMEISDAELSSPITFSTEPTVHSVSVQYDASTDQIAGCHSVDGTIGGQPGAMTVTGDLVNCMAYAPSPPPPPDPATGSGTTRVMPHM